MAVVRAVLLLLPLWVSVCYNMNIASHALTGSGSKPRNGGIPAPEETSNLLSDTNGTTLADLEKPESVQTGKKLIKSQWEASGRSTADSGTEQRLEADKWFDQASGGLEASSASGSSCYTKTSSAKRPSSSRERSIGEQTANPLLISASMHFPHTQSVTKPRSLPHLKPSMSTHYVEQFGSTISYSSTFPTQGFTGGSATPDIWPWRFQTQRQTGSKYSSSVCQKDLTSCVRNGTVWCGRVDPLSCSCDVSCKVYGDCCADFADVCPSIVVRASSKFRRHSDARVVCPALTNHLFVCSVVTRKITPKIETAFCAMQKWMLGRVRPVTDVRTRIAYVFGNISETHSPFSIDWKVELFFLHSHDFNLNDAEAIRRELQAMDKVVMVAHPPHGVEGRPCIPDVIRTCPLSDEKMKQACSAVTSYVQHPATSEVFANKFCLACHGLDSCESLNASVLTPRDAPSSISAFLISELIDGTVITCTLKRLTVSLSTHVKWRKLTCTMENNVFRDCTFTACIVDHELQDGACIHVNRSVSVQVYVHHFPTQTSSAADASSLLSRPTHGNSSLLNVFHGVIQNLISQVFVDVTSGTTQVKASPDPLWDFLVSLTFWTRLSDRQLSVATETLTSKASRVLVRESLKVRGLVGRVTLCVRVSTEQRNTVCRKESLSLLVSGTKDPHRHLAPPSSRASRWASVVSWPSLALTVVFWQ